MPSRSKPYVMIEKSYTLRGGTARVDRIWRLRRALRDPFLATFWVAAVFLPVLPIIPVAAAAAASDVLSYLPGEMAAEGVRPTCAAERFVGKGLFDYMDGGAELYLAFGFTEIGVRSFQKGEAKATVEIYSMGGPAEAFGVYAFQGKGEHPDLGAVATFNLGLLSFFKDRFYVRVVAMSDRTKARDLLLTLGKRVISALPGQSVVPAEVALLPPGAVDGSVRYLPNPESSRTLWFDGEGEVLLTSEARAFVSSHLAGGAELRVAKVSYPTAAAASKACLALSKKLEMTAKAADQGRCSSTGKLSDDLFSVIESDDKTVRWVSGAADEESGRTWLKKIQ